MHAADLARQLKILSPDIKLSGLGGEKMQNAGVKIYYPITKLAVVGFIEVLKHYGEFKKIFNLILNKIDQEKPDTVILVDYPGFNLRLAKEIKKRNIKVIYYISPQIWAWGKKRIHLIKKIVDKMLVVFKFEQELYEKHGVPCEFVGHPLLDNTGSNEPKEEILNQLGLEKNKFTLSLLPGSRTKEVERLLPAMLDAARIIGKEKKNLQLIILKSPSVNRDVFDKILEKYRLGARIIENKTYNVLSISDFAIVASGTATLQTALMQVPFVLIYKISWITYLMLRPLIRIKNIGLVNVVAGRRIIPELIQSNANGYKISKKILSILNDPQRLAKIRNDLSEIKLRLGKEGAAKRAAEIILKP